MMPFHPRFVFVIILALWVALWGRPAAAQSCGVSGSTSASIGAYNPFSPSGFNEVSFALQLTRVAAASNAKTRSVNFYLVESGRFDGLDIRYQGNEVLHPLARGPFLSLQFPSSSSIYHNFGNARSPDTVSIPLTISIPPGVDLAAGATLSFDLLYICDSVGPMDDVWFPRFHDQALTIRIEVASALQANWAGPSLSFGEIGSLDNAAAAQRSVQGAVRVASSGPYSVSVASANGYRMTYPDGSLDDPQQRISYSANFLGRLASPGAPAPIAVLCRRAGLAGRNLPLSVRLLEGGAGKLASPNYRDTLTVTVTPLAASSAGGLQDC